MRLHTDDILGGSYKIRRKIGAGSFGEIYLGNIYNILLNILAKNIRTNEEVAIKTVI